MADFTADLQSLRPSFPFLDFDPNMEHFNQIAAGLNPNVPDNSILNLYSLIPFSSDSFLNPPEPEFPGNVEENFPGLVHHLNHNAVPIPPPDTVPAENEIHETKKRRSIDMPETSSANSPHTVSEAGSKMKNNSGRGKRVKGNVTEKEKPKEVVHVRARRGQATDSHSLAERVRRGKINEKLRCLQNIVPGCYKTMGMAVMLDEIINYVQSLQQQVEFLSMKLTAASTFYNFNSETDALETMQRARASEARELAKFADDFQSSWSL